MRDRMYRKFAGMTSAPEVQQFFEAALEMEEAKEKDYARTRGRIRKRLSPFSSPLLQRKS